MRITSFLIALILAVGLCPVFIAPSQPSVAPKNGGAKLLTFILNLINNWTIKPIE
jgi:hypothetical protein